MRLHVRTIILLVFLLLLLIFAGINWAAFTESTTLSLLVTSFTAPIGLLMLGVVGFFAVLYVVFLGQIKTKSLLEASRSSKQLEKARALAEKAESSRFAELHQLLETELTEIKSLQREMLTQSETAAVDLAETVLGETEDLARRLDEVEGGADPHRGG
jgi:uncharacterized integral membrane protein